MGLRESTGVAFRNRLPCSCRSVLRGGGGGLQSTRKHSRLLREGMAEVHCNIVQGERWARWSFCKNGRRKIINKELIYASVTAAKGEDRKSAKSEGRFWECKGRTDHNRTKRR